MVLALGSSGLPYTRLLHPADRDGAVQWLNRVMDRRQVPPLEVRLNPERGTASVRSVAALLQPGCQIAWEDLSIRNGLAAAVRMNERLNEFCAQLKERTVRDALTGLYNRQYFEEELARFRNPRQCPVSVLLIDGDEFAVVLPRTGLKAALACKEDILRIAAAISSRDEVLLILSIGVVTGADPEAGVEELVGLADMDMYRAKESRPK